MVSRVRTLLVTYDILNLVNVPPFIKNRWIRAGKQYPKDNTPYEVLWAREDKLKIPELHINHLRAQSIPVAQFGLKNG